jgi:tRNA-2-methylthio-N6-dimethylallyladenosine synthase
MKTYLIKTFGCQMNHSDSERVSRILEESGFVPFKDQGMEYLGKRQVVVDEKKMEKSREKIDLIIFNTCSVRQKSEDKAIGAMQEMLKEYPNAKIGVTGCMVRQTGAKKEAKDPLLQHNFIDFVFRIEDCVKLPKILENIFADFEAQNCDYENDNYFNIHPNVTNKFQVFVPIMQGCDKFCSYCIVPHTRGREISRPMDEVFDECKKLVKNGAKEITLLGQNVNSYRDKGEKCFAKLLQKIDELHSEGLSRLRFTAAHPQDFTDDVIDALATMKTGCPYVHLPSQHGSNSLLQDMERNYTVERYEEIIQKIREKIPGVTISTDIIVGFPGETEEQFQELLEFGRRVGFDFSFTAIYSPRKNTKAGEMTDKFIPEKIKKERFRLFDEVVKASSWANREKAIGKTLEVLVEKSVPLDDGLFRHSGRSREFFEVYFTSGRSLVGQEVPVKITKRQNYILDGELV